MRSLILKISMSAEALTYCNPANFTSSILDDFDPITGISLYFYMNKVTCNARLAPLDERKSGFIYF